MDGRSHIKVHTDEWTQVYSARSSLVVTHLSTTRARRYLTSVDRVTCRASIGRHRGPGSHPMIGEWQGVSTNMAS